MRRNGQPVDWTVGQFGINLIGFATGNLGLGIALRNTAALLERKGIPFCVVDVDPGGGRMGHDWTLKARIVNPGQVLPHPINLFHMNPPEIFLALQGGSGAFFEFEKKMNVCVPFWELPLLPPVWVPFLEKMDMVLAPSQFMRHALETQLNGIPCRYFRQGLSTLPDVQANRKRWNLPSNKVVFMYSFDMASDISRKNPMGVLDAFSRCAEADDRAIFILKTNNLGMSENTLAIGRSLKSIENRIPNLHVMHETLTYSDLLCLYSSVDVFVSLHRGEGLGLGMMECMALGKPVIATGWSGNMDFMDDTNSCLVEYKLVPVNASSAYFSLLEGVEQKWAEPSAVHAGNWMSRLINDTELRKSLGDKARQSIRKFVEESWNGTVFDALKEFYNHQESKGLLGSSSNSSKPVPGEVANYSVALHNRNDSLMLPGGDTVVLEKLSQSLRTSGVDTRLCLTATEVLGPRDIVQLMNITRAKDTYEQLLNSKLQARPSVLISLYEDLDRYLVDATKLEMVFFRLAEQRKIMPVEDIYLVPKKFELPVHPLQMPGCKDFGIGDPDLQAKILSGVDYILTSGKTESHLLRKKFKISAEISEVHFGIDPVLGKADGRLFTEKYGLKDFALCVGRFEIRKNQFALIEIFRNMPDKSLVLIGYFNDKTTEAIVRAHAPKNVHFLQRVSKEELYSAYAGARVHVLASWYELPGLVSLEAAAAGARIVSTSWGTAKDYFHDRVHYCEPNRPESIRKAILEAFDSEHNSELREFVLDTFTWEKAAKKLKETYAKVLAKSAQDSKVLG